MILDAYQEIIKSNAYWTLNKTIVKAIGVEAALFLSELVDYRSFLESKDKIKNGWFYHTQEDVKNQTGLTFFSQKKSVKLLINSGILETITKGLPKRQWYRLVINETTMDNLINGTESNPNEFQSVENDDQCPRKRRPYNKYYNNKKHSLSNPTGFDGESKKSSRKAPIIKSSKIEIAETTPTRVVDKNIPFKKFAILLSEIIKSNKNIKTTPQKINTWANSFRLLHTQEGVDIERIESVLNFYKEKAYTNQYIPIAECGKTFRDKFVRIESSMERMGFSPIKETKKRRAFYEQNPHDY